MEKKKPTNFSRREFLQIAGLGTAGVIASACVPAPPASNTDASSDAPAAEVIEISAARHGIDADAVLEEEIVGVFRESHPEINVKPIALPWEDYNTKIPVMIAGGTAPDTYACHPALLFQVVTAGGAIPINDFIDADSDINYDDILFPGDAAFGADIMGLPLWTSCHSLRFNKNLFEEAGLPTPADLYWEGGEDGWNTISFVENLKELSIDSDGDGQIDRWGCEGFWGTHALAVTRAFGGDYLDDLFEPSKCTVESAEVKAAVQWMADNVIEDEVQPSPALNLAELGIEFGSGVIGIGMAHGGSVENLRAGREYPFNWDFVPLPAGPAGFIVWGDTDQAVTSNTTPNPDAVYEWMSWRSSADAVQQTYDAGILLSTYYMPTRESIFDMEAYNKPLTDAGVDPKMIRELYKHVKPDPFVYRTPAALKIIFTIVDTEIKNVLRGVKGVDEAMAEACALTEEALAEVS
ncbi:extracellular solute-binding protein [Chloroflexi bacterium TSY]|nr:extracellular solute-binding protein [Chloroflexi bacterium TSY]